ncbi:MAG: LysR family transcriptional regulator [Candidatus Binatia bacterium]
MTSQMPGAHVAAIRTLVFVIDAASLTAAGRRLGLTPSAVSKQISRLEGALGARLLERTTRNVRATAAGRDLYQRTRALFDAFEEAETAVRDQQHAIRGRVRLSASPAFGRSCLPPVLAVLAAAHPQLEFDVVLSGRRVDFIEDDIDLAVREGGLADSSLTARPLGSVSIVLCAAPAYLERRGRPRRLEDLQRHDLLAVPASSPATDIARLRGSGGRRLRLVPRMRVNDLFALRELAERGAGIAVLPDFVARAACDAGTLLRVLPRTHIARLPVHAVYPSRRHLPQRVQVVLDALRTHATLG